MNVTPIQMNEERATTRGPRMYFAFDPLLLLAALGLVACSLMTLRGPEKALAPHNFVSHQALYAGIGLVAAIVLARIDYSRFREYRYFIFGTMVLLNLVVYGMPAIQNAHRWIRTSRRWISLFFRFARERRKIQQRILGHFSLVHLQVRDR